VTRGDPLPRDAVDPVARDVHAVPVRIRLVVDVGTYEAGHQVEHPAGRSRRRAVAEDARRRLLLEVREWATRNPGVLAVEAVTP
jgi:hypothetical protein